MPTRSSDARARRLGLAIGLFASALIPQGAAAEEPPAPVAGDRGTETKVTVRYTLEDIEIHSDGRTGKRVILPFVPFTRGQELDVSDPEIELTRYRLLSTGYFAEVRLSLRKGSRRGLVVLVIDVLERNTFRVENLWFGIAADEDAAGNAKPLSGFMGLEVGETNLLGTGVALGAGIALAAGQIALRAHVEDPAFLGSKWSALFGLVYVGACDFFGNRSVVFDPAGSCAPTADFASVAYKRYGGTLGTSYPLARFSQLALGYHLEQVSATVPVAGSELRGTTRQPIDFAILPGKSFLSTLRAALVYDSRDTPFLPRRGWLASASITAGVPPLGSAYAYARAELGAQRWWQLPRRHVIRASAYVGGIAGDAPFFEKFYIGDFTDLIPDRVLDLTPDRRQPPNLLKTDIVEERFGDFAAKLDVEYRVPLYTGRRSIYGIDLFLSTGLWGVATHKDFTSPASGYSGFARAPIDLTYNLGLRLDTSIGGATIALSNLLGLIPAGSSVQH